MEQQPNMPPQAPPKGKGMSRGCLIGLIALGVLLVLIIGAGITCYVLRDEMGKSAAIFMINEIKQEVAVDPPSGVDTTHFNRVMDEFLARMQADSLNLQKLGTFFQTIQSVPEDSKVDSAEVQLLIDAMINYYPSLEDVARQGRDVMNQAETLMPSETQ